MSQTSEKKLFSMRDQFETKLKVQQDKGEESVAKLQEEIYQATDNRAKDKLAYEARIAEVR